MLMTNEVVALERAELAAEFNALDARWLTSNTRWPGLRALAATFRGPGGPRTLKQDLCHTRVVIHDPIRHSAQFPAPLTYDECIARDLLQETGADPFRGLVQQWPR